MVIRRKTASARLHFNTSAFSLQEFAIDTHHRTSAQKRPDKRIKYCAKMEKQLSGCLKNVSSRKCPKWAKQNPESGFGVGKQKQTGLGFSGCLVFRQPENTARVIALLSALRRQNRQSPGRRCCLRCRRCRFFCC